MSLSTYLENAVLNLLHGGSYSVPGTTYFAAFTVSPTASGGGTEVSGGSYARVAVVNNGTNWGPAVGGQLTNNVAITFPSPTANWGTVVAIAEFDASSGGNMLQFGPLSIATTVVSGGAALQIPIGGAIFTAA